MPLEAVEEKLLSNGTWRKPLDRPPKGVDPPSPPPPPMPLLVGDGDEVLLLALWKRAGERERLDTLAAAVMGE